MQFWLPNRRTARMKKSCGLWNTSVLEMALSPNSNFWRSWKWMVKTPTLCLGSWRRSFLSPATTPCPSWETLNLSSGAPCAGMTSPGTLKSSSSGRTGNHSRGTAEGSSPSTLMPILKSFWREPSKPAASTCCGLAR